MRDFRKNFRSPVLFAGGLRQASGFQKATKLAGEDSCLRRQVLAEVSFDCFLKEHRGADNFIRNHQTI